jgi:hypothetical protein
MFLLPPSSGRGFEGADWRSGRAGCYLMRDGLMAGETRWWKENLIRICGEVWSWRKKFGDPVNRERIFSIYVDGKGSDCLTTRFEKRWLRTVPFRARWSEKRWRKKSMKEMFVETLDNFQHSMRLIPESRSCTLNSSRENLRTSFLNEDFRGFLSTSKRMLGYYL